MIFADGTAAVMAQMIPAAVGGIFTLIGVAVTARLLRSDGKREDNRMYRRAADDKWKAETTRAIAETHEAVADVRERMAGLEAVFRMQFPDFGGRGRP